MKGDADMMNEDMKMVQGETPEQGETPVQGETPEQGNAPEHGETPVQGETPMQGNAPVQGSAPEQGETPVQGDAPEQGEAPEQGDAPVQSKTPVKKWLICLPALLIAAAYLVLSAVLGRADPLAVSRGVVLIVFGYIAAYLDWKTRKVPNQLVLAMLAAWAVYAMLYVVFDFETAMDFLLNSLIGGAVGGGFFLLIYLISHKGVGGGDVKLAAALGLLLTFYGLMSMLFFCSVLTALVSGLLLLTKRVTMKSAIPLVPFLYIGTLVTVFLQ